MSKVGNTSNVPCSASGKPIDRDTVIKALISGSSTEGTSLNMAMIKHFFNSSGNYAKKLEVGGKISEGQAFKKQAEGANVYDSSEVDQTLKQTLSSDALPNEGLKNCNGLDRVVGRVMTRPGHEGKIVAKAYVTNSSGTSPVQVMVINDPKTSKT